MRTISLKVFRQAVVFLSILALLAVFAFAKSEPAKAQAAPTDGMVCTSGPNFTLTTHDGYIGLPDGNVTYMWGFSSGTDGFQYPGPILCVNEGDTVTVVLHNTLSKDVSIVFPGQENVLADGQPDMPVFDGLGLVSLAKMATANGGNVTYSFVATRPGTFLYHSGTNSSMQVPLGLFGALVVRPAGHPDWGYGSADSAFNPTKEYISMFSEVDPNLNSAIERGRNFDMKNYHPRYWLINGRGFPDTIAPNFASWLPGQPYGALVRINPYDPTHNPLPAMMRYLAVGTSDFPFHPHGNNVKVIGRDGSPLKGSGGEDLAYDKFSIPVGPGQTWDALFTWHDAEGYDANSNQVPVTIPSMFNVAYGTFFSGSPYLGTQGPIPVGLTSLNQCGEYYHVAHNHALSQITSWGVPMTGMATYTRIDPPLPNNCP